LAEFAFSLTEGKMTLFSAKLDWMSLKEFWTAVSMASISSSVAYGNLMRPQKTEEFLAADE